MPGQREAFCYLQQDEFIPYLKISPSSAKRTELTSRFFIESYRTYRKIEDFFNETSEIYSW